MGSDIDLSSVGASEISAVLARAADLIAEHGWVPTKGSMKQVGKKLEAAGPITTLQAITLASHEIAGTASPELHTASLDAVCLDVFGRRQGNDASVSRWDRHVAEAASEAYAAKLLELRFTVIDELRRISQSESPSPPGPKGIGANDVTDPRAES